MHVWQIQQARYRWQWYQQQLQPVTTGGSRASSLLLRLERKEGRSSLSPRWRRPQRTAMPYRRQRKSTSGSPKLYLWCVHLGNSHFIACLRWDQAVENPLLYMQPVCGRVMLATSQLAKLARELAQLILLCVQAGRLLTSMYGHQSVCVLAASDIQYTSLPLQAFWCFSQLHVSQLAQPRAALLLNLLLSFEISLASSRHILPH